MNNNPKLGEQWVHADGDVYTVLCLANTHAPARSAFPPTVVYVDRLGRIYTRYLEVFLHRFTKCS